MATVNRKLVICRKCKRPTLESKDACGFCGHPTKAKMFECPSCKKSQPCPTGKENNSFRCVHCRSAMWFSDGGGKKTVPTKGSVAATPKPVSKPLPATKSPVKGKTTLPPSKRPINDSPKPVEALKSNFKVTILDRDDMDIPPGQVRRSIGDVFMWDHCEYIVQRVSATSATAICMNRNRQTATNKLTGETATFEKSAREIRISSCCDRQDIIRREENFQPQKPGAVGPTNKQSGMKENEMKINKALIKFAKSSLSKGISEAEITKAAVKDFEVDKAEVKAAINEASGGGKPAKTEASGQAGSAAYVRELAAKGLSEKSARAKAVEKFPLLAQDRHWCCRWETATKVAAAAKSSAKSATKAPAKKAPPVKQVAAKKPAPKAKPVKTTPPPPRAVEAEPMPEQESAPE